MDENHTGVEIMKEYVLIVRCRDCMYSKEYEDGGVWCERLTGAFRVDHDGFCKWGKKDG